MADCHFIDDLFEKKILSEVEQCSGVTKKVTVVYDVIPNVFKNIETWPKTTNTHCWNCNETFTNTPIPIISSVDSVVGIYSDSDDIYAPVIAVACWFNCAQAYINDKFIYPKKSEMTRLLHIIYKVFTGHTSEEVFQPSPSKFSQAKYGLGILSESEYQSEIETLSTSV
jgi:hypothetical protein